MIDGAINKCDEIMDVIDYCDQSDAQKIKTIQIKVDFMKSDLCEIRDILTRFKGLLNDAD